MEKLLQKTLIMGIIKNDDSILMRKKFLGAKPYKETWYSFGCELSGGNSPKDLFIDYIHDYLGINISFSRYLSWDTEIKEDHDGVIKRFVYLDLEMNYVSGEIKIPGGLEEIGWISKENLKDIDIVPPSVEMFKKYKYL